MKIIFMHNPAAGVEATDAKHLTALLKKCGHKVTYQSVKEKNYEQILEEPTDLVLAAGGDGTIKRVVLAVHATGHDIPISALPLGTANNLART
ncbi:MAG: acylglycerol kinase family protein, partial [Chthoniobacterales bacterium]